MAFQQQAGGFTGKEVKGAGEFVPLKQRGHLPPPHLQGGLSLPREGWALPWTWSDSSRSSYGVSSFGHEGRRNAHVLSSHFGLSGISQTADLSLASQLLLKLAMSLNESYGTWPPCTVNVLCSPASMQH